MPLKSVITVEVMQPGMNITIIYGGPVKDYATLLYL